MPFRWPAGFSRIPEEDWTLAPVDTLAKKYDTVENHGWYANLDPTVDDALDRLGEDDVAIDYSGGTGILIDRLLAADPDAAFGVVNVDSSPKFLRLSLEKLRNEPRVAFRLIRFLKGERRLERVDEVLGPLADGEIALVLSTNAIHLYDDLDGTLASWRRVLRPGGSVLAQSGNIRNPEAPSDAWIIDDTVEAVHEEAERLARKDEGFAADVRRLDETARRAAYDALRRKFFLPPRPLAHYVAAFEGAGFEIEDVTTRRIEARTRDWFEFLSVYHEGVLGWVGGSARAGDAPASDADVARRLRLLGAALDRVLAGRERFEATWTYLAARRP